VRKVALPEKSTQRRLRLRSASKTALFGICLLLADLLLPQQDAYTSAEYGFPMLAAVGAAGCIGYLLSTLSRFPRDLTGSLGLLFGDSSPAGLFANSRGKGEEWPLLVALLFGSLLVLLSGLGGWVDSRPRVTRPAAPSPPG